jgi:hypothetical protein
MRIWTVAEANAELPRVAATVARIAELAARTRVARERVSGDGHAGNGETAAAPERELRTILGDLDAEGIVVRDLERGLIDFTAETRDGRRYWLCHLAGEPAVEWWHWPADGFAGRRPISQPPA